MKSTMVLSKTVDSTFDSERVVNDDTTATKQRGITLAPLERTIST